LPARLTGHTLERNTRASRSSGLDAFLQTRGERDKGRRAEPCRFISRAPALCLV